MKRLVVLVAAAGLVSVSCLGRGEPGSRPSAATGIQGRVVMGPRCPVERQGSPCPDRPIEGVVVALRSIGNAAGNVRTDASGRFSLPLAPGTYLVYAREIGDNPRESRFERVTLVPGRVRSLILVVDTGIR
jgi:hypothetical protein